MPLCSGLGILALVRPVSRRRLVPRKNLVPGYPRFRPSNANRLSADWLFIDVLGRPGRVDCGQLRQVSILVRALEKRTGTNKNEESSGLDGLIEGRRLLDGWLRLPLPSTKIA